MSEAEILSAVLVAVNSLPHAWFFRANAGAARTSTGGFVRFGLPGQPDVLGCCRGVAVAIETKTRRGKQRPDQKKWQAAWERGGGKYILARSIDDALAGVREATGGKDPR